MKYICEVNYENGYHEIIFIKAKNDMHLEYKIVEHLIDTYSSIMCVKEINYAPFKRWMFKETYHYYGRTFSNRLCMQKTHDNWLGKRGE